MRGDNCVQIVNDQFEFPFNKSRRTSEKPT